MAIIKNETLIKKKKRTHKKVKKVKPVLCEEDNESMAVSDEEGDHGFKKVKAESKELDLDVKEDSEEVGDSDEDILKEKLASIQQQVKNIRAKLKEKAKRNGKGKIKEEDDLEKEETEEKESDDADNDASPKKKPKKEAHEKSSNHKSESSFEERRDRSLLIKNLPEGVKRSDLWKLSSDIVGVHKLKGYGRTKLFCILFKDEGTAISNFNALKSKTIKGQHIVVDYCGKKSSSKKLFVKNLPQDITEDDFKKLSEDIIEIYISERRKKFAFLMFDSQEKAESNYEILKDQVIRGHQIFVDKDTSRAGFVHGMKQILVSGLPVDATLQQVASHFRKALQISLDNSSRTATISFATEKDAKEAYEANKEAEISEHKLTLELCKSSEERRRFFWRTV